MTSLRTLRSALRLRRPELDAVERRLARCASVEDLRRVARRRLPRGCFDYIDGGAEDEVSLARSREAWEGIEFRPRVLREVGDVDPSATLLGRRLPLPLAVAPTGFTRIAHSEGELAVARAAARRGIPYTLSTLATRSIEEVAAVSSGPRWFQVYVWRDRGLVKELVQRAAASGYEALMLTVDTPVFGRRERDVRSGFTLPPRLGLATLLDGALHPGWALDFLRADPIEFANVVRRSEESVPGAVALAEYVNRQFDPGLGWGDVAWLRGVWGGPLVLKGIQCAEDAERAAAEGVEAIVLSNHGGRQLDGAPAPIALLPEVAERVGDRVELLCDGGVRRGSDLAKAVALGARACLVGRSVLYGLAAGGERGVDLVLAWLDEGLRRTLALTGHRTLAELGPASVRFR